MSKFIEFQSNDGVILVEVEEKRSGGRVDVSNRGNLPEKAKASFEDAMGTIKSVAEKVVSNVNNLSLTPDEVNVKLGVKFSAAAGAIIAKSSVEGNLEISLTWKKVNDSRQTV